MFGDRHGDGLETKGAQMRIPLADDFTSNIQIPAYDRDGDELEDAREWVLIARAWVAEWPTAWQAARDYVAESLASGRRIEAHNVAAAMKAKDHAGATTGAPMRLNNTVVPLFMRWLADEHPEARGMFEFRKSRFDRVPIGTAQHG